MQTSVVAVSTTQYLKVRANIMKRKQLDFIVIGAQKSATTTIYKYLKEHERIVLPEDKEAPFFNSPNFHLGSGSAVRYEEENNDFDSFLDENFAKQDPYYQGIWGKISPQYMSSHLIPSRIKQTNPDAKIIAILRHPIKRAFSHYLMASRRGTEARPFEQAILESITHIEQGRLGLAPTHEQGYESEADFYTAWGEYGRVLESYVQLFGKQNVLVMFAEELELNPQASLDELLEFIGLESAVKSGWQPTALGKKFHQGGGKPWINPMRLKSLVQTSVMSQIYSRVPGGIKSKLRYWVDQINVRKDSSAQKSRDSQLSDTVLGKLYQLYRADAVILTQLGYSPPWKF